MIQKDDTSLATVGDVRSIVKEELQAFEQRMKLYFDVAVDQIKEAVHIINTEKIQDHDTRITRLEVHTGLR